MALTNAQLNAHLRSVVVDELQAGARRDRAVLEFWTNACLRHIRLGDADSIEAGNTIIQFVMEAQLGRNLNAADLHYLKKHLAREVDPSAGGEFE